MKRYFISYEYKPTREIRSISVVSENEKKALEVVQEKAADFEFTELRNIEVKNIVKVIDDKDNYYECEGCT